MYFFALPRNLEVLLGVYLIAEQGSVPTLMADKSMPPIIHCDPAIMGGAPVFLGTRVPLQNLIDSLEGGETIDEFLVAFPTVEREQVVAVIEAGKTRLLEMV